MGTKLVIKHADFSANAIEQILPSHYDYELLGMFSNKGNIPVSQLADTNVILLTDKYKVKHYLDGTIDENVSLADGMILKYSDNLFAVYNGTTKEFNYLTESDIVVPVEIHESARYQYTEGSGFALQTGDSSWMGAKADVQAGDIILYKGAGGSGARLMGIIKDSEQYEEEYVSYAGTETGTYTACYIVKNAGTVYFSSQTSWPSSGETQTPSIRVLR